VDYLCEIKEGPAAASGRFEVKNWVGVHLATDVAYVKGDEICDDNDAFACFYNKDLEYPREGETPLEGQAGSIDGGFAGGTTFRILGSFERLLHPFFGLEARVGFAISRTPALSGSDVTFFPFHGELRGKVWFLKNISGQALRPSALLGGGIAQIDTQVNAAVNRQFPGQGQPEGPTESRELETYNRLGIGFVTTGVGAVYVIKDHFGINLNVNAMYTMPVSGFVIEPSLGGVYGF
jgi:hypothetical protein